MNTQPSPVDTDFLKQLHDEKLRAQEARTTYTLQKLIYATALLGIGSLSISLGQGQTNLSFNLIPVLFLVPFVALVFDFYILGEDYSVKRLGVFLGRSSSADLERRWETWIAQNRDPFAPWAMPLLTTLLTVGAGLLLWRNLYGGGAIHWAFWPWGVASVTACWGLFFWYRHLRQRAQQRAEAVFGGRPAIPDPIAHLRATTTEADHLLTPAVYRAAKALFVACRPQSSLLDALICLAPEYGRSEFLCNVSAAGEPTIAAPAILDDYRKTVAGDPNFELWFREATAADGKPFLLAARWLCHLIGLRHPTAELFIDHPTLPDHTLVQVRGLDKFEAPGCFDLPSAGHVVGTDTAFDTVLKEMKEELNLDQGDILELAQIGSYPFSDQVSDGRLCNAEYRTVYRGRLADGAWQKLQFSDGEVAAIAFFSLPALQELLRESPDRVASGLAQSLATYLETRDKRAGEGS